MFIACTLPLPVEKTFIFDHHTITFDIIVTKGLFSIFFQVVDGTKHLLHLPSALQVNLPSLLFCLKKWLGIAPCRDQLSSLWGRLRIKLKKRLCGVFLLGKTISFHPPPEGPPPLMENDLKRPHEKFLVFVVFCQRILETGDETSCENRFLDPKTTRVEIQSSSKMKAKWELTKSVYQKEVFMQWSFKIF
ncbi:hypothetical protein TNIN_240021 [Trichonephila inaurata madagascariensis]|uniref:Uncharacterized protein n=1 Tax=Trichonephila inaurata madagascariensis TaxID=2747483 RepID=A0A8X6XDK8_9ARAC|nr:hypothetical protein TNIN_240021 [Trichonephila inaurata madagascariensis]